MYLRLLSLLLSSIILTGCVHSSSDGASSSSADAAQAYTQLGLGYLQEGHISEAKAALAESLQLEKDNPDALAALAMVFQREGDERMAERHFRQALAKRPNDARLLNNYAGFLYQQKRFDLALVNYQKALLDPMYPQRARVLENLGMTAMKAGQMEQAQAYFEQALQLDEHLPHALLEMAKFSLAAGDHGKAQSYYLRYSSMMPATAATLELGRHIALLNEDHDQVAGLDRQLKQLNHASLASPYSVSESR